MKAFHSFWSKPNYIRNQGAISYPDFELLTTILSALQWKKMNGPIEMITDSGGAAYFTEKGLGDLWDRIDHPLDDIDPEVNPVLFWAAGKLYALKMMDTPCVMLDTDLIVWQNMDWIENYDLVTAHPEDLNPYVYPHQSIFKFKDAYQFPKEWDFSLQAANTAFCYIKNQEFKTQFTKAAIEFFRHVKMDDLNPVTAMCFAEQRVISMMADAMDQKMGYLLGMDQANKQELVSHTWGFKQMMRDIPAAREEFCMRCVKRIMSDFPDAEHYLQDCADLVPYLEKWKEVYR